MSILKDISQQGYLLQITDKANDLLLEYWEAQKKFDAEHNHPGLHIGDAPQISMAQCAAVIDALAAAKVPA